MIKIVFLYLFITANFTFAQDKPDYNIDDSMNLLFSTQQSDFIAEVLTDSEKLVTEKKLVMYLNLSSGLIVDSTSIKLNLNSSNGKVRKINILKKASSGSYVTSVSFSEPLSYRFIFSFTLKDSSGNARDVNFSFYKNVELSVKQKPKEQSFMGMSTGMLIVMGAAMIVMMAIVLAIGGSHK